MTVKIKLYALPLTVLLFVCLSGCGTSPDSKFYRLNTLAQDPLYPAYDARQLAVKIGPLTIPESLDQSQIVTTTGANQLKLAEFHRWGGNLQGEIQRIIGQNISILLPTQRIVLDQEFSKLPIDFQLFVNIREFTGELGGEVTLNVDWTLVDLRDKKKQNIVIAKKSVLVAQSNSADYSAYVTALSGLLTQFSGELVDAIQYEIKRKPSVPGL